VSKPATKDKPLLFVSKMPLFGFIRFQTKKLGYKNILCNWLGPLDYSKIRSFYFQNYFKKSFFESEREKFDTSFFRQKTLGFLRRGNPTLYRRSVNLTEVREYTPPHFVPIKP
jgi:hypothetical protein